MGKKNSKIQQEATQTLAQYLAQRAQQVRDSAAFELSHQDSPDIPVLPRVSDNTIAYWDAKFGTPDSTLIQKYGVEPNPETCIYTATTKYGDKDAVFTGNKTFRNEYNKHGYVEVPNDSSSVGDLVQLNQLWGLPIIGRPYHAVMQTSTSDKGTPLFSYSRGDTTPFVIEEGDTIKTMQKDKPLNTIKGRADSHTTYRYVGSPSKQAEWTDEYNNKYGTQRSNGRLGVTSRWAEGGPLKEASAWDKLSMAEKAEMMKVAVKNGITTLPEIRAKYNEFAEGRDTGNKLPIGGPISIGTAARGAIKAAKQRLYENLSPIGYDDLSRVPKAILLNEPDRYHDTMKDMPVLDEIYAQYLGIPEKDRHFNQRLEKSAYKPTMGGEDVVYYKLPKTKVDGRTILGDNNRYNGFSNTSVDTMVLDATYMEPNTNKQQLNTELGYYTVGRGRDESGDYVSYYDKWDINPFKGGLSNKSALPKDARHVLSDISMDFGTPVHIYDRIYFDDYYGIKGDGRGGHYLPEIIVTGKKHSIGGPLVETAMNKFKEGGSTDADLVDRIIKEEGFNTKPENIGDGKITLGSGLTAQKWHDLYKQRGNKWSNADNSRAVAEEVANRRRWAEKNIPNWDKLPDSSQKALLSYKYNYDFNRNNSPKLFDALEKGDLYEAARQMDATSKDSNFKKGLQARRQREQKWFLSDVASKPVVPTIPFEQPVSTIVFNPYAQQIESTRIAPIMIPDEDSYVTAHRLTEAEERKQKFQERMEALRNFNRLLQMTSLDNTAVPTFMPTTGNTFLGNIMGLTRAEGGKIHIKPSHRGRLTELKKRTGKSEAELYRTGSPATRKMITFARSARKWKHGLGGNLFYEGGKSNIFRRPDGTYFYQADPDSEQVTVTPQMTIFDNPALWTYVDDNGKIYTPKETPQFYQGEITQEEEPSIWQSFLTASNNYYMNPVLGAPARWDASWSNDTNPIKAVWDNPTMYIHPYTIAAKTVGSLASKDGLQKTWNLYQNSDGSDNDRWQWQRSLAGDALETLGLIPAIYAGTKLLKKPPVNYSFLDGRKEEGMYLTPDRKNWDIQAIKRDLAKGIADAQIFLGSDIKAASDAHNIELAKRLGMRGFTPYPTAQQRASVYVKPEFNADKNTFAGFVVKNNNNPALDKMGINVIYDTDKGGFHETLHRGNYGEIGERTFDPKTMDFMEYHKANDDTRKFYKFKTDKLLVPRTDENAEWIDYMQKQGETPTNSMELGRRMGLAPGAAWPGRKEALELFTEFSTSLDPKTNAFNVLNWKNKPRRVWDAITGRYFTIGLGIGTTASLFNNNDKQYEENYISR